MAYVRAALERNGYSVVCTESGVDASAASRAGSSWVWCPICAHRVAWTAAMSTPGFPQHRPELASRLVFITGDIANEETAATLRKTGAPCVEKPFRVKQFISVVEKTIGKAS